MIGNKAIIVTDFKTGERQNAFIAIGLCWQSRLSTRYCFRLFLCFNQLLLLPVAAWSP